MASLKTRDLRSLVWTSFSVSWIVMEVEEVSVKLDVGRFLSLIKGEPYSEALALSAVDVDPS